MICLSATSDDIRWELGDWRPARKYHKKLARMYGVTVDELLSDDSSTNREKEALQ